MSRTAATSGGRFQPVAPEPPRGNWRALLVDDDEGWAQFVRDTLDAAGATIELRTCASLAAAAEVLATDDFDCVLLDLQLPDARGLHAVSRVRNTCPTMPIVVLSGSSDARWGTQALARGAQDFLMKSLVEAPLLQRAVAYAVERKFRELEIARQATMDDLTGLPNRRAFGGELGDAHASSAALALLAVEVDVDLVIDGIGHEAGDELLAEAARRIRLAVRPGDTVGRMAYDAFSVLCRGVDSSDHALRIADRIARGFEHPVELAERTIFVRPSVGIALGGSESTPTTLLRDADAAKYEAKAAGGTASAVCTDATRAAALDRLELHNDLHGALERDELSLRYQPIVDLSDGSLVGVEALLRWHHPVRGEMAPDDFVPLAESSGLIIPIGEWVLNTACAQLAEWAPYAADGLVMSVNLSAPQVLAPGLLDAVAGAVARAGVPPGSICLELTERAFLDEPDYVADTMRGLNQLGVQLALDDFGTGYSSLRWLAEIPLDVLKVDRSFVAALNTNARSARVTETIVRLGHMLEMNAVGEGIEDASQLARLRALGCTHGQGYLFAPPLTPEGVEWWLRRRRRLDFAHN